MNETEKRLARLENQVQALAHQLILVNEDITKLIAIEGYDSKDQQIILGRIQTLRSLTPSKRS